MNILRRVLMKGLAGIAIIAGVGSVIAMAILTGVEMAYAGSGGIVLDYDEQTHLVFMREEEKLARDVYIKPGDMYPEHPIFGNIDDSEQQHTDAVNAMIEKYGLQDPGTNDNVGVYTGKTMAGTLPRSLTS